MNHDKIYHMHLQNRWVEYLFHSDFFICYTLLSMRIYLKDIICVFFLYGVFIIITLSVSFSECRVPDDSDAKSGMIRQRQNCLESRIVEGQDLPVLTLAPCIITKDLPAANQVQVSMA